MRPEPGFNERELGGHRLLLAHARSPGRVLEVGCASGYFSEQLVARGHVVTGVERDPVAAEAARRWCAQVITGDVESIPLSLEDASFELVVCADVLEHLREPQALLQRLAPLLVPRGQLLISAPNVANWSMRVALLGGRWRYRERGLLDRGHLRFFTRSTLIELVEGAGFEIVGVDLTVPTPLKGVAGVERLARAVGRLRPSLFAYQFIVVAVRR